MDRQMPIVNVQRRVDGNLVYGSINDVSEVEEDGNATPPQFTVPGAIAAPSNALLESIGSLEVKYYKVILPRQIINISDLC